MGYYNGVSFKNSNKTLKNDFSFTYALDIAMWPALMWFNFKYMPINYQPSVVYCGSMVWTAVLSAIYNREK
jgi:hypothetical protein